MELPKFNFLNKQYIIIIGIIIIIIIVAYLFMCYYNNSIFGGIACSKINMLNLDLCIIPITIQFSRMYVDTNMNIR